MSRPSQVDPRGLRVSAAITSVVLAAVLVIDVQAVRVVLLAFQVAVFAVGALIALDKTPYALLFATVIRPRLGGLAQLEDSRPPRFAQFVGLAFTVVALAALLAGAVTVALIATGFALVAALLNATTGFCLGCEMYLVLRRLAPANP
jgi:hypothetical protein